MNETQRQLAGRLAGAPGGDVPARALPAYQQIKRYVVERIANGDWKPGGAIPTEAELVKEFGVARMTVSRALRELTAERVLTRIQGAGTFVERRHYESTVLEIRNIADEIAERGHRHSARVLLIESSDDQEAVEALGLRSGPVFHSRIVHYEEDEPIQFEDRYVNPALFPAYLEQDFTIETPNHYMVRLAPIQRAEFRIYAEKPNAQVRRHLVMEIGEPCLLLSRRTWVGEHIATSVRLWHPASRFHLAGRV
ncbi:histidine utilization repressor [Burkholderia sp. RS02]|uniref:histidine utilization repressor n=1 Tax=unclassified Burkholderia TaxID=2613784 RepID=UPI003218C515